jgi:transcription antitermination factor NusG
MNGEKRMEHVQLTHYDEAGKPVGSRRLTRAELRLLQIPAPPPPPEKRDMIGPRPCWHVVLTEPNREGTAATHLGEAGYSAYVGFFKKSVRQNFFRRRKVTVPIFPGYLFLHSDPALFEENYAAIKNMKGVRSIMTWDGSPVVIPDAAIDRLRATERRLAGMKPMLPFKAGDKVDVEMEGWTLRLATVEALDDEDRISILTDFMGRVVRMTVSANRLKPIA